MPNKKKPKKIILGLAGEIASGKDTVAAYLKQKYKGETISFSTPLRDILDRMHLPQNRENLVALGTDLRTRFGRDILAKIITADVLSSKAKIISLPNIRLEEDIIYLKKIPGFHLVAIDVDDKTRYQRLTKRSQNADDKTKTWKQFLKDAKLPTEIHIKDLMRRAKYHLDNSGSLPEFQRQIEELLKKLK